MDEAQRASSQVDASGQLEATSLSDVGLMANFIAHDLCNHLTAVSANVELLSDPRITSTDRNSLQADLRATIHCMKDNLNSLILFARTRSPLDMRRCSLGKLIREAVRMVRQHPDSAGVDIAVDEAEKVRQWVDPKRLGSALYNLLLNACQAAKRGSSRKAVKVEVRQEYNCVSIRFIDSGPGVPRAIRETLFQPFISEGKSGGIGLGLTIATCAAKDHGGDLYLEESKPGRTVFLMQFPRRVRSRRRDFVRGGAGMRGSVSPRSNLGG